MKKNRWTIKYKSLTYIYLIRPTYVSHWSIIPTMMFIHQIILTILSKITRPWNIGCVDLYLLCGQSLGHTVSLSENMTLMHQTFLCHYVDNKVQINLHISAVWSASFFIQCLDSIIPEVEIYKFRRLKLAFWAGQFESYLDKFFSVLEI